MKAPVIGVPTSVGYGVALNGIAPLLTMLNACSTGVTVMNIDNGFGAAAAAGINDGEIVLYTLTLTLTMASGRPRLLVSMMDEDGEIVLYVGYVLLNEFLIRVVLL